MKTYLVVASLIFVQTKLCASEKTLSQKEFEQRYPLHYPLHYAAQIGNYRKVKDLCASSPQKIVQLDHTGRTPLEYSIIKKDNDCIREFIRSSNHLSFVVDPKVYECIKQAIHNKNRRLTAVLLPLAEFDSSRIDGHYASCMSSLFDCAIKVGSFDIVYLLLIYISTHPSISPEQYNRILNEKSKYGYTLMDYAIFLSKTAPSKDSSIIIEALRSVGAKESVKCLHK